MSSSHACSSNGICSFAGCIDPNHRPASSVSSRVSVPVTVIVTIMKPYDRGSLTGCLGKSKKWGLINSRNNKRGKVVSSGASEDVDEDDEEAEEDDDEEEEVSEGAASRNSGLKRAHDDKELSSQQHVLYKEIFLSRAVDINKPTAPLTDVLEGVYSVVVDNTPSANGDGNYIGEPADVSNNGLFLWDPYRLNKVPECQSKQLKVNKCYGFMHLFSDQEDVNSVPLLKRSTFHERKNKTIPGTSEFFLVIALAPAVNKNEGVLTNRIFQKLLYLLRGSGKGDDSLYSNPIYHLAASVHMTQIIMSCNANSKTRGGVSSGCPVASAVTRLLIEEDACNRTMNANQIVQLAKSLPLNIEIDRTVKGSVVTQGLQRQVALLRLKNKAEEVGVGVNCIPKGYTQEDMDILNMFSTEGSYMQDHTAQHAHVVDIGMASVKRTASKSAAAAIGTINLAHDSIKQEKKLYHDALISSNLVKPFQFSFDNMLHACGHKDRKVVQNQKFVTAIVEAAFLGKPIIHILKPRIDSTTGKVVGYEVQNTWREHLPVDLQKTCWTDQQRTDWSTATGSVQHPLPSLLVNHDRQQAAQDQGEAAFTAIMPYLQGFFSAFSTVAANSHALYGTGTQLPSGAVVPPTAKNAKENTAKDDYMDLSSASTDSYVAHSPTNTGVLPKNPSYNTVPDVLAADPPAVGPLTDIPTEIPSTTEVLVKFSTSEINESFIPWNLHNLFQVLNLSPDLKASIQTTYPEEGKGRALRLVGYSTIKYPGRLKVTQVDLDGNDVGNISTLSHEYFVYTKPVPLPDIDMTGIEEILAAVLTTPDGDDEVNRFVLGLPSAHDLPATTET